MTVINHLLIILWKWIQNPAIFFIWTIYYILVHFLAFLELFQDFDIFMKS